MGGLPSLNEFKQLLDIRAKGCREIEHGVPSSRYNQDDQMHKPHNKNERHGNQGSDSRSDKKRNTAYSKDSEP